MKEEIIINLDLQQDEGDYAKLAQLKGSLINIKEEQARLNKAYKDGNITVKELASETVRLEANQKKLTNAYTETQRKVTGLKSPFEKLGESIKEQANQVNVAGLSLASFANPVTATIALLGGLAKMYASSTNGAKDLEFASNQLSAAFNILGNNLADVIGKSEDGEGFFTQALNSIIRYYSPGAAAVSKNIAMLKEQLEDLGREEQIVRADNNERIAENAQLLEKAADGALSYEDRLKALRDAIANLRTNESELLKIKNNEVDVLEKLFEKDKANEDLESALNEKKKERSRISTDIQRKVSSIEKLESNLLETQTKQTEQKNQQNLALSEQIKLMQDQWDTEQKIQKEKEKEQSKEGVVEGVDRVTARMDEEQQIFDNAVQMAMDAGEAEKEIDEQTVNDIYKNRKEKQDKLFAETEAKQQKSFETVRKITAGITQELVMGMTSVADAGRQILKSYLIMAIRAFKEFILVKVGLESFATPDSILTFGATGFARKAILFGLIEGVFSGVESAIAGFAQGGVVSGTKIDDRHGKKIKRSNGDNRLVTVKTGEVILNERQQAALGGDDTFRRLGVPGFAVGGMVQPVPTSGTDFEMYRRLMNVLGKRQVAVVIEDVENLIANRAQVREQATL